MNIDLFKVLSKAEKAQGKLRGQIAAAVMNRRHYMNLSHQEFAKLCGISKRNLKKIESCNYNFKMDELISFLELLQVNYVIEIMGE